MRFFVEGGIAVGGKGSNDIALGKNTLDVKAIGTYQYRTDPLFGKDPSYVSDCCVRLYYYDGASLDLENCRNIHHVLLLCGEGTQSVYQIEVRRTVAKVGSVILLINVFQ